MIKPFFTLALLSACTTAPKTEPATHIQVCVVRVKDQMCWLDEPAKLGIPLTKIDGYFAEDPESLDEVMFEINQCKGK